jgi:hypothetical protein
MTSDKATKMARAALLLRTTLESNIQTAAPAAPA